jgi:hypothetical protein
MQDVETIDLFLKRIIDKYTAEELCEMLGLTTEQIVDAFYEQVLELEDV